MYNSVDRRKSDINQNDSQALIQYRIQSTQEELDKLNEKLKQYQINDKQSEILKNHNKNRTRNTLALIQQLSKHLQDLKQIEIKLKSNEFTKDEINYMSIEEVNQNGVDLFKSIVEQEFEKDQEYLPEKYQKENFQELIQRNYEVPVNTEILERNVDLLQNYFQQQITINFNPEKRVNFLKYIPNN